MKTAFLILTTCSFCLSACHQTSQEEKTPISSTEIIQDTTFQIDSFLKYNRYDSAIQKIAQQHQLDWMLVKAVIMKESHFDDQFISTAGAVGLMQLMPRKGSFVSAAYQNFERSRLQKRNATGKRMYLGKSDVEWADTYATQLDSIKSLHQKDASQLYETDARFDPSWNLDSGMNQLGRDFQYFRKRGHGPYASRIYALAAYNEGRGAVVKDKSNPRIDRIPINRQTELYVGYIERILTELKKQNGHINEANEWVLKI